MSEKWSGEAQKYVDSVEGNAHMSAVKIISKLEYDNALLRSIIEELVRERVSGNNKPAKEG